MKLLNFEISPAFSLVSIVDHPVGKLVKLDETVSIGIEFLEEGLNILGLALNSKFVEDAAKLVYGQIIAAVQVKVLEDVPKNEFFRAFVGHCAKLQSERVCDVLDLFLKHGGLFVLVQAPSALNEVNELFIMSKSHTEVSVEIEEFLLADPATLLSALEIGEELLNSLALLTLES